MCAIISQMRGAGGRISNIAEGQARNNPGEFRHLRKLKTKPTKGIY